MTGQPPLELGSENTKFSPKRRPNQWQFYFLYFSYWSTGCSRHCCLIWHSGTLAIRNRFRDCCGDGPVEFGAI